MKKATILLLLIFTSASHSPAQEAGQGIIEGRIYDANTSEPIPFTNIIIWGTNIGTTSDLDGRFLFTGIAPGYVELRASSVGFDK